MFRRFFFPTLAVLILVFGSVWLFRPSLLTLKTTGFIPAARAEAENENDSEEYSSQVNTSTPATDSSTSSAPGTKTILIPQAPVTITKWVPVTKQVPADGYDKDTDGDGIVDALDPHPTIPEQEFFTDSDGDGVPDAYDQYPGHDDFYSFPDNADANLDGILDTYESTAK